MARIRQIKPELRRDQTVAEWPLPARYAWTLLWGYLDDDGYGIDDLRLLVADLFPFDRDVTEKKLNGWLNLMTKTSKYSPTAPLCRFQIDGASYLHSVKWERHQRVNRPAPSRLPQCPLHPERPSIGRIRSANDSLNESEKPSQNDSLRARKDQGSEVQGSEVQGSGLRDQGSEPSREVVPLRADIEDLCRHLADHVEANGSRRPQITAKWRDAARLMLDVDGRTVDQVRRCIEWCQADEFWRGNVLSMPKLREKYEQLRLQANRSQNGAAHVQQVTDDRYDRQMARAVAKEASGA